MKKFYYLVWGKYSLYNDRYGFVYCPACYQQSLFTGVLCSTFSTVSRSFDLSNETRQNRVAACRIRLPRFHRTWAYHLEEATQRVIFEFNYLKTTVTDSDPRYICFKFTRSEFSPLNFDEIQRQYDEVCKWYKTLADSLPESIEPSFPPLRYLDVPSTSGINDPILMKSIDLVKKLYDDYEARRKERERLLQDIGKTEGEDVLYFLSPIFLCIALAIRITKVTGEIRLEKQSRSG